MENVKINDTSVEALFWDVMFGDKNDKPIHLIEWNVYTEYDNDSAAPDNYSKRPTEEFKSYSAMCKDGIYSGETAPDLICAAFEPFSKDGHSKAPVIIDAVHDIKITGCREIEQWCNQDGLTHDFIMDNVHYCLDGKEILHEINEPAYHESWQDPLLFYFQDIPTSQEKFIEFCQEHPAVFTLPEDACFTSFDDMQTAVSKAEEHSLRVEQAQMVSNNVTEQTQSDEKESFLAE